MNDSGAPVDHQDPPAWLHQAQESWRSMIRWTSNAIAPNSNKSTHSRSVYVMNTENQRSNNAWGDQLSEKQPGTTRVYIQNVNGFNLDGRGGQFDQFCTTHQEVQADISCGQEHKLDSTQPKVRSILFDTAKQHWDRSKLTLGTSPIPFSSHYKPGGTFILTTGSITGRV